MEPGLAAALLATVQLMGLLYAHRRRKKQRIAANTKKEYGFMKCRCALS